MKTIVGVLLALLTVTFCSCSSDSKDEPTVNSFISADGKINVQLENYAGIDSLEIYSADSLLGKCKLTADGKMIMQVGKPELMKIGDLKGVFVSDTAAMISVVNIVRAFDASGKNLGRVECTNFTTILDDEVQGNAYVYLMYCDRDVVMKGTYFESGSDSYDGVVNSYSTTKVYDVNLKKGWNAFMNKIDVLSTTTNSSVRKQTFTSTIPSDMKWRLMINQSANSKQVQHVNGKSILFQ